MLTDGSLGSDAYFNIKNKTVGSLGANITTANIKDIGNGWLRLEITLSAVSSYTVFYQTDVDGSRNFTGDGVKGTYIYQAQLETGTEVTSTIPTTTVAVTRSADIQTPLALPSGATNIEEVIDGVTTNTAIVTPYNYTLPIGAISKVAVT